MNSGRGGLRACADRSCAERFWLLAAYFWRWWLEPTHALAAGHPRRQDRPWADRRRSDLALWLDGCSCRPATSMSLSQPQRPSPLRSFPLLCCLLFTRPPPTWCCIWSTTISATRRWTGASVHWSDSPSSVRSHGHGHCLFHSPRSVLVLAHWRLTV